MRPSRRKLRVLITAGPTREYLDSVRFISNGSSGRMGYALAAALIRRGHEVVLVSGPVALKSPGGVETIMVETGAEMLDASESKFRRCDAAIFCAAVCDYRPAHRAPKKLPKSNRLRVELVKADDIAEALGRTKGRRTTIVFALEDHDGRAKAEAKLIAKHADAVVLNAPANIGDSKARAEFLIRGRDWLSWPSSMKMTLARRIVLQLEGICSARL